MTQYVIVAPNCREVYHTNPDCPHLSQAKRSHTKPLSSLFDGMQKCTKEPCQKRSEAPERCDA